MKNWYRVFQVRCHKKATRIGACAHFGGNFEWACVDSRRFFVTTDLKIPVGRRTSNKQFIRGGLTITYRPATSPIPRVDKKEKRVSNGEVVESKVTIQL